MRIVAGDGESLNRGSGGDVQIQAGTGYGLVAQGGSGPGGKVTIQGGLSAEAKGGSVELVGGNSAEEDGGDASLVSGTGKGGVA